MWISQLSYMRGRKDTDLQVHFLPYKPFNSQGLFK